jgi:hypothetical protein
MEQHVRKHIDMMEGFSTFGQIWVEFDAPLDLKNIRERHLKNSEFSDDAVYLVDLETGEPVSIDLGQRNFPATLEQQDNFLKGRKEDLREWDTRRDASNFLFETYEEDQNNNGILDPGEDTDNDGVLDHPNIWPDADLQDKFHTYNYLLEFYEKETNTLIMRPLIPLKPKHVYAVVLTGRLSGENGKPVESPFSGVNHADQTTALKPLQKFLSRDVYKLHIEQISPDDKDYVAFAWSFTTQPIYDELVAVRNGLYGKGQLAFLADKFPADITWDPVHSKTTSDGTADWKGDFYRMDHETVQKFIQIGSSFLFGDLPEEQKQKILADFNYVDSMVTGYFITPDLMCSKENEQEAFPYKKKIEQMTAEKPAGEGAPWEEQWKAAYEKFHAEYGDAEKACSEGKAQAMSVPPVDMKDELWETDLKKGYARACNDLVPVIMTIPVETERNKQPFPVAIYYHGYTLTRTEMLSYAGYLAKMGIASLGVDAPGHGDVIGWDQIALLKLFLDTPDFIATPAIESLMRNRVRDLMRSGLVDDSGGDYWTADTLHTRDAVRQTIVDTVQLIRGLRLYDGIYRKWNVTDHPESVAGDFDGNGKPDIGGPENRYFIWGQSLGGIIAMIAPAVEPYITGAAPVSGGGGLSDIAYRSVQGGVREAAQLKMIGPMIMTSPLDPEKNKLSDGEIYLYWYAGNWYYDDFIPIGKMKAKEGNTLRVRNITAGLENQGVIPKNLKLMIPIQADGFDRMVVEVIDPATGKIAGDFLDTWQRSNLYQGWYFCKDSPLEAPTEGWGYRRNTPDLRKFMAIAQMILDPADPVNYARHVFLEPLYRDEKGNPMRANLLVINTAGDMNVPVNTGIAYARAAGLLDFDGKSPACPDISGTDSVSRYKMSGNDLLLKNFVIEGLEKLEHFKVYDPAGKYTEDHNPGEIWGLYDPDDLDQGTDGYNAPSPSPPLRWTRLTLSSEENAEWEKNGCSNGPAAAGESGMRIPYLEPVGAHTFEWPKPPFNNNFDMRYYLGNVVAYFFATGEIRDELCMSQQDVCGIIKEK